MQVTTTDPGESKMIPMDNSNTADHNGDTQSRQMMSPGKNPVGNEKDCD